MQESWKWYYQLKYEMQVLDITWLTNCNHSILLYIFWFLVPKLFKYIWNFLSILLTNMKVVEFFSLSRHQLKESSQWFTYILTNASSIRVSILHTKSVKDLIFPLFIYVPTNAKQSWAKLSKAEQSWAKLSYTINF